MSLRIDIWVDLRDDFGERLAKVAGELGVSVHELIDRIVSRALSDEEKALAISRADHETVRNRRAHIICNCCQGGCARPFIWRGMRRCGCPTTLASGKSAQGT